MFDELAQRLLADVRFRTGRAELETRLLERARELSSTIPLDQSALAQEVVRGAFLPRTHLGLDFFDASINRIAAWVIGVSMLAVRTTLRRDIA